MPIIDEKYEGSIGSAVDTLVRLTSPVAIPLAAAVLIDDPATQRLAVGFTHGSDDQSETAAASMMVTVARMMLANANNVLEYSELEFVERSLQGVHERMLEDHPCQCGNCSGHTQP